MIMLAFAVILILALTIKLIRTIDYAEPKTDIIIYAPALPENCERHLRIAVKRASSAFSSALISINTESISPEAAKIAEIVAKDTNCVIYGGSM